MRALDRAPLSDEEIARAAACEALGFAGISLDLERNASLPGEGEISAVDTKVRTFVVTAREDIEVARQVRALCQGASSR